MTVEVVKEFPEHPRLGRRFAAFDTGSRSFAAVGPLAADDEPLRTRTHRRYPGPYDQGYSSECVVYSGKGVVNTAPVRANIPAESRLRLETTPVYKLAQTLDYWAGEDYDGTSVLGGAKAFKQIGLISTYRWCFGLSDVLKTLSGYGPVQIGVTWYENMFYPDASGLLTVDTESGVAGGHAIELIGINVKNETVTIINSWGPDWGVKGRAYMKWADLNTLLEDYGEATAYVSG